MSKTSKPKAAKKLVKSTKPKAKKSKVAPVKKSSNKLALAVAVGIVLLGGAYFVVTNNKAETINSASTAAGIDCSVAVKVYPNNCLDVQAYTQCEQEAKSVISDNGLDLECKTAEGRVFKRQNTQPEPFTDNKIFSVSVPKGWSGRIDQNTGNLTVLPASVRASCIISTSSFSYPKEVIDENAVYDETLNGTGGYEYNGMRPMNQNELLELKTNLQKQMQEPTDLLPGYTIEPVTFFEVDGVKISGTTDGLGGSWSQVVSRYNFVLEDQKSMYTFTLKSTLDLTITSSEQCETALQAMADTLLFIVKQ